MQEAKKGRITIPVYLILYEILPWLTAKPLFRFKLVCKEWQKVISSELFRKLQSRRCIRCPSHFLYDAYAYNGSYRNYNYILVDPSFECRSLGNIGYLIASSNGLVCISDLTNHRKSFDVQNPFTGEMVSVSNKPNLRTVALAFEPFDCCNPYFALVGPSVTNSERVGNEDETWTIGFTLYSSRTGKWSLANTKVEIIRKWFRPLCCKSDCRTVYTGGKVYWKEKRDVFWFHIKEDSGGTVALPNYKEQFPQGEIGDCNGELTYSIISIENIEIWALRFNDNMEFTWVHQYCLSLREIFKDCYGRLPSCCYEAVCSRLWKINEINKRPRAKIPLHYSNNHNQALPFEGGDVLFGIEHLGGSISGVIFSYNVKTRVLQTCHTSRLGRSTSCFFSCKSSLASVPKLSNAASEYE